MQTSIAQCHEWKVKVRRIITLFWFPEIIFMLAHELFGFNPHVFMFGKYQMGLEMRLMIMLFWLVGYPYAFIRPLMDKPPQKKPS